MINNFYTLRALVREWRADLEDAVLADVFSQVAGEITLAFSGKNDFMLRASAQRPLIFVFRTDGISKKKRNVATLFESAHGRRVETLRIARRDRMIFLDLEGGTRVQLLVFGAQANALLVNESGAVEEAFRGSDTGRPAPEPRTAPEPEALAAFEKRWDASRNRLDQALRAAFPIFDRTLAEEALHRAGVATESPEDCSEADRRQVFEASRSVIEALKNPAPRIYGRDQQFSLITLAGEDDSDAEHFDTVSEAVRVFVRRRLAERHFRRLYDPLEEALSEAGRDARHRADRIEGEGADDERADRYEHFGHLLMASSQDVPAGAEKTTLPDLFGDGEEVVIPLDPAQSAVQNAERYYDKARSARRAQEEAEQRLERARERADEAERLLGELRAIDRLDALKKFRKREEDALAAFAGQKDEGVERVPFRRIRLASGYEVWVGRNAQQNHDLTFHHAQKYDLWMHARDVPGAHAVLRLKNRDDEPPRRVVHEAAAVAAHFSKARGHGTAPVMVARRKHVTSPSGAPPGAVRVEYEDDVMVEPGLPG
jgi:predicted ribosome quality control (RQC) complex YloA/Tae2 family protein